ncbi:MarR family transcriptional regulator [Halorubrum tropicale]|uniref:HTH marR-type domain-containing protein n=1 Tax=Halorubrum tropicale TaxID=1765655 RepID=A0A0M9AJX5_9EURY|nr:MarR family transcriptional regulator [Halorubrum tropicale]KOX92141.1 hypothetical protein AMR74_16995 [Halorubrum tropicale]
MSANTGSDGEAGAVSATGNGHPYSVADLVEDLRDQLGELPATASIVYLVLRQSKTAMSSREIADVTLRSRSSIHRAAKRLHEVGLIERRASPDQGRSQYVWRPLPVDDVADRLDTDS